MDCNKHKELKNLGHEIILSFSPDETFTDDKLKEITLDYLDQMGVSNSPFLAYRHQDKSNPHVRILMPFLNFEGQQNLKGLYKKQSVKVCLSLEEKHKLLSHKKGKKNTLDLSLNEINANK